MRQELVGYILGALDEADHEHLDQRLAGDAALQKDLELLKRGIEPLDYDEKHHRPPQGLALRTCELVDQHRKCLPSADMPVESVPAVAPLFDETIQPTSRRWSVADLTVAAGIAIATTLLVVPAIGHSRFNAQIVACQDNLRQIGTAIHKYAQRDPAERIPSIPEKGPLAVAGVYAPKLIQAGLIDDPRVFFCNDAEASSRSQRIPKWSDLTASAQRGARDLADRLADLKLSYAFNLGFYDENAYRTVSLRNRLRPTFALMADSPCPNSRWSHSRNHGGSGQNVLFEDGHVTYLKESCSPGCSDSNFYLNDEGVVAAGKHPNDSVVGGCLARPCN